MGELVMILGQSGSGKSASIETFDPATVGVFSCAGKRLPFKKRMNVYNRPTYKVIKDTLKANKLHAYVIDDSTYLMQFAMFEHAKETGYGKFTTMALDFEQLLEAAMSTDDDTIVYFLHHPQFAEDGRAKPQSVGKMLDNQLCIEGLFPIVLEATVKDGQHVFVTQSDGYSIAKSPQGMFGGEVIANDLHAVDSAIRDYWGMAPLGGDAK